MDFINKIKYDLGVNQQQLAEILECSPTFITLVRKGERVLPDLMLKKLIDIGGFNDKETVRIMNAYLKDIKQVRINLEGLSLKKRREILDLKWRLE